MELRKCARCDKLFSSDAATVCGACRPMEDADFNKIREVLETHGELSAQEVANEADVEIDVVFRLLDAGRIQSTSLQDVVPCGRCGAPAISLAKRLCRACLTQLDQECAEAMRDIRQRMAGKSEGEVTEMRKVLEEKRERREGPVRPEPAKKRMVAQEIRRKKERR